MAGIRLQLLPLEWGSATVGHINPVGGCGTNSNRFRPRKIDLSRAPMELELRVGFRSSKRRLTAVQAPWNRRLGHNVCHDGLSTIGGRQASALCFRRVCFPFSAKTR